MKNFTIRAFVLGLAVAGFASATVASKAASHKTVNVSMLPQPLCVPSDPSYCGMH